MYFEKHLKTFVFFLLCIFAQNTFSMKISVRGIILANNVKSVFLNELQSASEETLKQACALLGAQIKVKKANPETQAIIKLAKMIDTPIGTTRFTSYKLSNAMKLSSFYAVRIYELLKKHEKLK